METELGSTFIFSFFRCVGDGENGAGITGSLPRTCLEGNEFPSSKKRPLPAKAGSFSKIPGNEVFLRRTAHAYVWGDGVLSRPCCMRLRKSYF